MGSYGEWISMRVFEFPSRLAANMSCGNGAHPPGLPAGRIEFKNVQWEPRGSQKTRLIFYWLKVPIARKYFGGR